MSAVYRTLYEKYEQNDVLHVGIQEVVEAEKEIDTFLKSLDRNQRDQLDTLLGRLSRAYEMQGFLFGGLASGAKWNGKTAPEPGDGYGGASGPITAQRSLRSARLTARQIRSYMSIRVSLRLRATGLDDSAIGKVCKGKVTPCGRFPLSVHRAVNLSQVRKNISRNCHFALAFHALAWYNIVS